MKRFWNPQTTFWLAWLLYLGVGVSVHGDFGTAWDEWPQREKNGAGNWAWVVHGDKALFAEEQHYYGAWHEMLLMTVEKALGIEADGPRFRMRHLVGFVAFCLFLIPLYGAANTLFNFNDRGWALFTVAVLALSPRFFVHAFVNSKDIPAMSASSLMLFTGLRALRRPSLGAWLALAFASALLVGQRLPGLGYVLSFWLAGGLALWLAPQSLAKSRTFWAVLLYPVFTYGFLILVWPILWYQPLHQFWLALKMMSAFPWYGEIRYFGEIYLGNELPWHYLPVWVLVSTPAVVGLGLLLALLHALWQVIVQALQPFSVFVLQNAVPLGLGVLVLGPIAAVLILDAIIYDGWRHVYFIYPAILLLAVWGIRQTLTGLPAWQKFWGLRVAAGCVALAGPVHALWTQHPFTAAYFNYPTHWALGDLRPKFELDYWGTGYLPAYKELLTQVPEGPIHLHANGNHKPAVADILLLPPEKQSRIVYQDSLKNATYFVTNFRQSKDYWGASDPVFEHRVYKTTILGIYPVQNSSASEFGRLPGTP